MVMCGNLAGRYRQNFERCLRKCANDVSICPKEDNVLPLYTSTSVMSVMDEKRNKLGKD